MNSLDCVYLDKLVEVSSEPCLESGFNQLGFDLSPALQSATDELRYLLAKKNGFVAFSSALNVYSSCADDEGSSLMAWNAQDGWRTLFPEAEQYLFFAEDIFCDQFAIGKKGVIRYKLESGEAELHSRSLNEWALKLLSDYDYETGWSLAHEWQKKNYILARNYRLLPKIPFVIGGEYEISNLVAVNKTKAIYAYKNLCSSVRDSKDGEAISVHGWI